MSGLADGVLLVLGGAEGPGWAGSATGLTLDQTARLVGGYRWIEQRLFEVLGQWAATEVVPEARVLFDTQSQQHAWHAELFEERLPVLDGRDPADVTLPPTSEIDQLLMLLATDGATGGATGGVAGGAAGSATGGVAGGAQRAAAEPGEDRRPQGGSLLRLAGFGRVALPRLIAGYTLHLRHANPLTDAALVRVLRLVVQDDLEAWRAAELMVQSLARRPHDLVVLSEHHRRLEQLLLGHPGLGPWPPDPGDSRGRA